MLRYKQCILDQNNLENIYDIRSGMMELNRVKQILSSNADIDVQYNGASVWIDGIDDDQIMATVHLRGPLEERTKVAIADLKEQ
jgi:small acid-soluble spore protein H (minor)